LYCGVKLPTSVLFTHDPILGSFPNVPSYLAPLPIPFNHFVQSVVAKLYFYFENTIPPFTINFNLKIYPT
jgi:hypothetical protein